MNNSNNYEYNDFLYENSIYNEKKSKRWRYYNKNGERKYFNSIFGVSFLVAAHFVSMYIFVFIIAIIALIFLIPEFVSIINDAGIESIEIALGLLTNNGVIANIINIFASLCSLTIPYLIFIKIKKKKIKDYISLKPAMPKAASAWLILGLAVLYMAANIGYFFYQPLRLFNIEMSNYNLPFPDSVAGAILYFITIVVIPAFFEEFAFRGVILNELRRFGTGFAIIASSVLFGLMHGSPIPFFYATALGVISSYIALKTGSLWFSIIIHGLNNGISYLFHYLSTILDESLCNIIDYSFQSVLMVAAFVILIVMIIKKFDLSIKPSNDMINVKTSKLTLLFFNPVMLVFIGAAIYSASLSFYIKS